MAFLRVALALVIILSLLAGAFGHGGIVPEPPKPVIPTTPSKSLPGIPTLPGDPRPRPPAPRTATTPGVPPVRTTTPASSGTPTWHSWWFYNRARYLPKHAVAEMTSPTTTAWGRKRRGVPWRDEAVRALLRTLADDHVDSCAGAALALGQAAEIKAVPGLTALLVNPETNRIPRESAALSLGMIGGETARDALRKILASTSEPARLRGLAALGLGLLGDLQAVPALAAAARDDQREVRAASLLALGLLDDPIARPLIVETARDRRGTEDLRVRAAAIHALGRRPDPETLPVLLEAARADRPEIRRAAVLALGRAAGPEDRAISRALARAIAEDRDTRVRSYATIGLGRTGSPKAIDILIDRLNGPGMEERGYAALAIALLGRRSESEALRTRLGGILLRKLTEGGMAEDTEAAVAIAMGLLGDRRGIARILPMLERSGRPAARGHGAVALALMSATETLPALRRAILAEKSPWVQREFAIALGVLRDAASVNDLAGLVRGGGSEFARANAAVALGRIATPESALVMIGLLTSPRTSPEARGRVAEALGLLLNSRPLPPLFPIVEDSDPGLALEAFQQVLHLL